MSFPEQDYVLFCRHVFSGMLPVMESHERIEGRHFCYAYQKVDAFHSFRDPLTLTAAKAAGVSAPPGCNESKEPWALVATSGQRLRTAVRFVIRKQSTLASKHKLINQHHCSN